MTSKPRTCYPRHLLTVILLTLLLSACALAPQTPKQTLAATYTAITATANTAQMAYETGAIDRETAETLHARLNMALAYVEVSALALDDQNRVEQARNLLLGVEQVLREAGYE